MALSADAAAGASLLEVDAHLCSIPADAILNISFGLNLGAANEEVVTVVGVGSLLLQSPLRFDHNTSEASSSLTALRAAAVSAVAAAADAAVAAVGAAVAAAVAAVGAAAVADLPPLTSAATAGRRPRASVRTPATSGA